jgi:adenosylcobinamide-phosphate synthase
MDGHRVGVMCSATAIAWLLDHALSEPPDRVHPVVWLGRALQPIGERVSAWSPLPAFLAGSLAWCGLAVPLIIAALAAERAIEPLPWFWAAPLLAGLLKPCFSWRMLRDEVCAVEAALSQSEGAGRARVAKLVSRDVSSLSAVEVRESAIEALSENLNDSVVAPLFWFGVAGLPGAVLYRFANTADAMWGYRGRYEWAGKWAARADDLLSWLPARISALLLLRHRALSNLRALRKLAGRTPSPNGGWPMGAMALLLGVRLRKPGVYALNESAAPPCRADSARALHAATAAAWLAFIAVEASWLLRKS